MGSPCRPARVNYRRRRRNVSCPVEAIGGGLFRWCNDQVRKSAGLRITSGAAQSSAVRESTAPLWKIRLVKTALVVGGLFLVLWPAWLPDDIAYGTRAVTEDSVVEGLQWVLLLFSATFWWAASYSRPVTGPLYRFMAVGCLAGAFGEADRLWYDLTGVNVDWIFVILGGYALRLLLKNKKAVGAFVEEVTVGPAAGFLVSAFLMIYVLARALGAPLFWKATLGPRYDHAIPDTVQGYLELVACYLILVGTLGICGGPRKEEELP